MKTEKYKAFYKFKDNNKVYEMIRYDDTQVRYYQLIKDCQDKGFFQLIINSRIMIDLIKGFTRLGLSTYSISLDMDDEGFSEELDKLLKKYNEKKENIYLDYIVQKLGILYTDNSIEIDKISLKDNYSDTMIYSNGILECTTNVSDKVTKFLVNEFARIIR